MNRRSKRGLERAIEGLSDTVDERAGEEVVIQYDVVGSDGTVVDSFRREFTIDQ